jgi:hypothetical protein
MTSPRGHEQMNSLDGVVGKLATAHRILDFPRLAESG